MVGGEPQRDPNATSSLVQVIPVWLKRLEATPLSPRIGQLRLALVDEPLASTD